MHLLSIIYITFLTSAVAHHFGSLLRQGKFLMRSSSLVKARVLSLWHWLPIAVCCWWTLCIYLTFDPSPVSAIVVVETTYTTLWVTQGTIVHGPRQVVTILLILVHAIEWCVSLLEPMFGNKMTLTRCRQDAMCFARGDGNCGLSDALARLKLSTHLTYLLLQFKRFVCLSDLPNCLPKARADTNADWHKSCYGGRRMMMPEASQYSCGRIQDGAFGHLHRDADNFNDNWRTNWPVGDALPMCDQQMNGQFVLFKSWLHKIIAKHFLSSPLSAQPFVQIYIFQKLFWIFRDTLTHTCGCSCHFFKFMLSYWESPCCQTTILQPLMSSGFKTFNTFKHFAKLFANTHTHICNWTKSILSVIGIYCNWLTHRVQTFTSI